MGLHIHIPIHILIHIHIHIQIRIHISIHTHIHSHKYLYTYRYIYISYAHTYTYTHAYTCTHTCTYTCTETCVHACLDTCMYTEVVFSTCDSHTGTNAYICISTHAYTFPFLTRTFGVALAQPILSVVAFFSDSGYTLAMPSYQLIFYRVRPSHVVPYYVNQAATKCDWMHHKDQMAAGDSRPDAWGCCSG